MILCQCAGVTETTLQRLVERGVSTEAALARRCGAGRYCGSCRLEIRSILSRSRRIAQRCVAAQPEMLNGD